MLTMWKSAEWKPVTPRTRSDIRIRSDLEVVIGGRLQAFDHDGVIGRVRCKVVSAWSLLVVQHLVEDYIAVAMLPRRRVPP